MVRPHFFEPDGSVKSSQGSSAQAAAHCSVWGLDRFRVHVSFAGETKNFDTEEQPYVECALDAAELVSNPMTRWIQ